MLEIPPDPQRNEYPLMPERQSIRLSGVIVPGTGGASGIRALSEYGGTLGLQIPHFLQRGLDLRCYYRGTINLDLTPLALKIVRPSHLFRAVQWHPAWPAEHFSFLPCVIACNDVLEAGLIYHPHQETKPHHFPGYHMVEVITQFIPGARYGGSAELIVSSTDVLLEGPARHHP